MDEEKEELFELGIEINTNESFMRQYNDFFTSVMEEFFNHQTNTNDMALLNCESTPPPSCSDYCESIRIEYREIHCEQGMMHYVPIGLEPEQLTEQQKKNKEYAERIKNKVNNILNK